MLKMVESATPGMEAAMKVENTSAAAVEPQASVSPETKESLAEVECPGGVDLSRSEKSKRMGGVCRLLVCYLRKMSPVRILKKMRDCYVETLGSCAQNYAVSPTYGMGLITCHASPIPPSLRMAAREYQDFHSSEFCLSPAFKKSFNRSLLELKRSGAYTDMDSGASPFRKSFSDFESCLSAKMRTTYSDAAALYSGPRRNSHAGYCGRSPGWAPSRALRGQAMMIFPIQEAPELFLASFRTDAQELRGTCSRKEAVEPGLPHREDGELLALTEEIMHPSTVKVSAEGFEAPYASMAVPITV